MDPWSSAQDVVCCALCQPPETPLYCEICHMNLCKDCILKHVSDPSKVHNVVSFKQHCTTLNHPTTQCDHRSEKSDFCRLCISEEYLVHKPEVLLNSLESKKVLQRDLQELEKYIFPKYNYIASSIPFQKAELTKNSQKLKTFFTERGKLWHNEIDNLIKNLKSDLDEMEHKHLVVLNKKESEIKSTISEITKTIDLIKALLKSADVCRVFEYKSRNAEFRRLPPKLNVSLPKFKPREIKRDQLMEQFGSLSQLSFTTEEEYYTMAAMGADSSTTDRSLLDIPLIISSFDTKSTNLTSLACLNDLEIWALGGDSIMKLYSHQGKELKLIETKSKENPCDIAVTMSGELVYADYRERTVNIVRNTEIQSVISLLGWKPRNVTSTLSGDLLVVMCCDDFNQTKVVRYFDLNEKQSIQYNDNGKPLYSSGCIKYITENRNLDICVSDRDANAVVAVNQKGKFLFNYTFSPNAKPFTPTGITTDSQSRILTADSTNNCIHIIHQKGQFLRLIENCFLLSPWGLSVDARDNLFVAENDSSRVKKIQYCK